MVTGSSWWLSSSITAPRPMRSSWCIGITERPSTTEISTLTLSTLEAMDRNLTFMEVPARVPEHGFGKLNLDAPVTSQVEWKVSGQPVAYPDALAEMEARAAAIAEGTAGEQVWLLEHPPIYTAGTSANDADLIDARFPVYRTGRGGQFTYHGPGQRVGYAMLDLRRRTPDVRAYVRDLEQWLIDTLAQVDVKGARRGGRGGILVERGIQEEQAEALW